MIAYMTAFARHSYERRLGALTWEIQTVVSHRYLEVILYMSDFLRDFEQSSREII
ncbi:YicC/YloC family endoribonuclease [Coxiella-like endosymbiont]|uniref:YicC/YloC family endoribonuclease n=1 Tax=Coxiella-like endosymbiont TaxID=1592897 RepID=UPI00272AD4EC|nr:YicC/YloC family endoribonuclease [Coxiella-like endosymbiont]